MNAALKLTLTETKLFLRETPTVFFTFAFPLMMLFIVGSVFIEDPDSVLTVDGSVRSEIGVIVTGLVAMTIAITGLSAMPTTIAAYRERGILRRMGVTPVHPATIVGAQIGVQLLMTGVGAGILIAAGMVFYDMKLPSAPLVVLPALIVGAASIFALGYVIASVIPTLRAAQVVGQALFFPMIFLSGATFVRSDMPDAVQRVSDFIPLTHVVTLVQDLWFDQSWNMISLAVIVGILVFGAAIGSRVFRWE